MKKEKDAKIKTSLRKKISRLNVRLIAAAVIFFAAAGIIQVRRFAILMEKASREQNEVIMNSASDSVQDLSVDSFKKYVISQANVIDDEFRMMRHDLEVLAGQVRMVLENPSGYSPATIPEPQEAAPGKLSLQLLYSDYADREDPALKDKIKRVGSLNNMIIEIVKGSPMTMDCMVSLAEGASIIADANPEKKVDESGNPISFNADRRPWYVGAQVHKGSYFSPVNVDNYADINEVMAGVPVVINGELAAVCGASIDLSDLEKVIQDAHLGKLSDACLINETGNVIYSSTRGGDLGIVTNRLSSLKESGNPELIPVVQEALKGKSGFSLITLNGEPGYIAYAPLETIGWSLFLTISQKDLYRTANALTEQTTAITESTIDRMRRIESRSILLTMLIAAGLIAASVFTSFVFAERLVQPIKKMTSRVSEMQGEDMIFEVEDSFLTNDEIEVLAKAFSKMSHEMRGYVQEIVAITAEKQRLDTELSVASEIQANMLPKTFPAFPDRKEFDLFAVMDPAKEVGGDFYDFFLIDDDHLAVVMADVSGKGIPAALFMVISKTLIKNIALSGKYTRPGEILADVNNRICEENEECMFVTVWLGILTISTGHMVSSCAGHEYPVFYRKGKGFTLEKDFHGTAIGAIDGVRYRENEWQLNPGDVLFLYTDGVPEATSGEKELYGNDRMLEALEESWNGKDLQVLLKDVRNHVDGFVGDEPQFDDLTMLALKINEEDEI